MEYYHRKLFKTCLPVGLPYPYFMTRRVKQSRSLLSPITSSFLKKLSSTDARLRRKVIRLGIWIFSLFTAYSLMSGTYGIPRIVRLELQKSHLTRANQQLAADFVDAVRINKLLLSDPYYIEHIARSRYYMIYPGETIYRYHGR